MWAARFRNKGQAACSRGRKTAQGFAGFNPPTAGRVDQYPDLATLIEAGKRGHRYAGLQEAAWHDGDAQPGAEEGDRAVVTHRASGEEGADAALCEEAADRGKCLAIAADDHVHACDLICVQPFSTGERMPVGHGKGVAFLEQGFAGAGIIVQHANDGIDPATFKARQQFPHASFNDFQPFTFRLTGFTRGLLDPMGRQCRYYAEADELAAVIFRHSLLGAGEFRFDPAGMGGKPAACRGQFHASIGAMEQDVPDLRFQLGDAHGQGGLRHAALLGRAGKVAVIHHCQKIVDEVAFNHRSYL